MLVYSSPASPGLLAALRTINPILATNLNHTHARAQGMCVGRLVVWYCRHYKILQLA
jgi:hypothetical protein